MKTTLLLLLLATAGDSCLFARLRDRARSRRAYRVEMRAEAACVQPAAACSVQPACSMESTPSVLTKPISTLDEIRDRLKYVEPVEDAVQPPPLPRVPLGPIVI